MTGPEANDRHARLITSLGQNTDLIELELETSSMVFFRIKHTIRLIRSIFPILNKSDDESVVSDDESVVVEA